MLGKECPRAVWYDFRWVHMEKHGGRMLRLFRRGHREEPAMVEYLRMIGATIQPFQRRLWYDRANDSYRTEPWDVDLDEKDPLPGIEYKDVTSIAYHVERAKSRRVRLEQWRFKDGHLAGDTDGIITGLEKFGLQGRGLFECKTVNEKGFKELAKKKVIHANPVHFVQMQTYMHYFRLQWALYTSVCKNDDELHAEIVVYKPEVAQYYIDRAKQIAVALAPPPKINESGSWWKCKFCSNKRVCHEDQAPQKSCRSCSFVEPKEDGIWLCHKFNGEVPEDFQRKGCDYWDPLNV